MTQEEARQRLKEICERNKLVAPEGYGLWPAARMMRWTEDQILKHFADTDKEGEDGEVGPNQGDAPP